MSSTVYLGEQSELRVRLEIDSLKVRRTKIIQINLISNESAVLCVSKDCFVKRPLGLWDHI